MDEYVALLVKVLERAYLSVLLLKGIFEVIRIGALYDIFPKMKQRKKRALILYYNDCCLYDTIWQKKYGIIYFVFNSLSIATYCSVLYLYFMPSAYRIAIILLALSLLYLVIAIIFNIICMIKLVNRFRCNVLLKIIIVLFNPLSLYILKSKKIEFIET